MLSLRLFGGLTLSGPEGPIAGRASQRRRLALLAILAHARAQPVSRDKLIALLWPETETDRARHLLADTVYVLRDALRDDIFVARGDDISLNPERVSSDIGAFFRDLEAGDRAAAVGRYAQGGPFLDGVHLTDAPEFERWVDAVRSQLTAEYRRALEELATEASRRGDHAGAISRWRQLAGNDPLSSRVALAFMRALADAGDVAGALEFARTHERVVQVELESAPDPAVVAFAAELRAASARGPIHDRGAAQPPRGGERARQEELEAGKVKVADHHARLQEPVGDVDAVRAQGETIAMPARGTQAEVRSRWILAYGLAVLALAGLIFGVWWLRQGPVGRRESAIVAEPSIAVLPLRNLGTDARDGALADGMTEELIGMLAKLGHVRVIASTSVFAIGRQMDVRRIADSLRVSHILEGGLARVGSRLRVQIRLVAGRDGSTRWSEIYDKEMRDVFSVQDAVARAVAQELDLRLAGHTATQQLRHQTRSIAAYELYLRGRDPMLLRSDSAIRVGLDYFNRAIAADSTYAAAYAGWAHLYGTLARTSPYAGIPRRRLYERAEEAALKAVTLDDSLAEAHAALGKIRWMELINATSAETELKRALALDSNNAEANEWLVYVYLSTGRPAEGLAVARRGVDNDPLSAPATAALAQALCANGRYDAALAALQRISALRPPLRRTAGFAGLCYARQGKWLAAIAELRQVATMDTRYFSMLGYVLARAGQREEARRIHAALLAQWQRSHEGAYDVARVYAGLGERDQAGVWLEKSVDDRSLRQIELEPLFGDLRGDARYERLLQRLGLQKR